MTKRQRQAKHAAEHRHMRDRLVRIFETASCVALEDGGLWYPRAEDVIADLSREFAIGRPRIAAVVAVLSPRQRWRKNIAGARAALEGEAWRAAGYDVNRDKARALIAGAPLESIIGGEKVTSFWANLIGSRTAVTVDVWAQRAALGYFHRHQPKTGRYARLVEAYRAAATKVGVPPREFQAIIWLATRPAGEHIRDMEAIHATS